MCDKDVDAVTFFFLWSENGSFQILWGSGIACHCQQFGKSYLEWFYGWTGILLEQQIRIWHKLRATDCKGNDFCIPRSKFSFVYDINVSVILVFLEHPDSWDKLSHTYTLVCPCVAKLVCDQVLKAVPCCTKLVMPRWRRGNSFNVINAENDRYLLQS